MDADRDINDRLGGQSGYGGTSNVLDICSKNTKCRRQSLPLDREDFGPPWIVLLNFNLKHRVVLLG